MKKKFLYQVPQVEVITMTVDTAIMQASGADSEIPGLELYDGLGDITWDVI